MADRFENLKKIPEGPAARHLAASGMKLDTKLDAPISAPVPAVLEELFAKNATVDILKLMAAVLPPRECVWWACLAARDIAGKESTPVLKAAETWVFAPNDENRDKLRAVLELAESDDQTSLAGTAAYYADGTLGTGDLSEHAAPGGAVAACVFGQNMQSVSERDDAMERLQFLIERALDIARGGNGTIPEPEPAEKEEAAADGADAGEG